MVKKIFFVAIALFPFMLMAQQDSVWSRVHLSFAVGPEGSMVNFLENESSDFLIKHRDEPYLLTSLSLQFFLHSNWGIGYTFQSQSGFPYNQYRAHFLEHLSTAYPGYDVNDETLWYYEGDFREIRSMSRRFLTVDYRKNKGKYFYTLGVGMGRAGLEAIPYVTLLKKQGENEYLEVSYEPDKKQIFFSTYVARAQLGYQLNGSLHVMGSMQWSYYDPTLRFTITEHDVYSGEKEIRTVDYSGAAVSVLWNLGILIAF